MKFDVKNLAIGILLGVCVTLSMGQRRAEPAPKLDADYRYQISVVGSGDRDSYLLWVLDHETKKVHSRRVHEVGGQGMDVKNVIDGR